MMKGTGAMTHFKQFDLNTINIRLQHVTFDVWKKQFNIIKTYAARFWNAENMFYSGSPK